MPSWNKISFQDAASPIMEQLIMFNDHVMMIIVLITIMVMYNMLMMLKNKLINRFLLEGQMIETIWTIIPAMMLILIAMPSLRILYLIEEMNNPSISVKAIGHQWFWSYEYSDFKKIEFESYMKPTMEINSEEFRLMEVDNRMIIPFSTKTRMIMTSTDVIHSWTIPSIGIKVDASPGRMNQGNILINRPGLFFGQCSEICGSNHSFMPISLEVVNMSTFIKWLKNF
uniref:cytochrome c oxidase subunit II n=1 Tax=Conlopa bredoni TaxID=3112144 RepID=UPI002E76FA27|nr:cytochrome c oxidase subunit II [Conlopa bredoni]WRK21429.1 cytochrome c oxidase subunit II [Conlopa bredoni]